MKLIILITFIIPLYNSDVINDTYSLIPNISDSQEAIEQSFPRGLRKARYTDSITSTAPPFYGLTYYPWRSSAKNCEEISDDDVIKDFSWISTIARNVQIFDFYCNLTRTIIEISKKNHMGIVLGISAQDEDEYQRQKNQLKIMLVKTDFSNVLGITVGRTSFFSTSMKDQLISRLKEIKSILSSSRFPNIPVTIIIDSPKYTYSYHLTGSSFFRMKVVSAKYIIQKDTEDTEDYGYHDRDDNPQLDPGMLYYKFLDTWYNTQVSWDDPNPIDTYYTEFGYPLTCCDKNSEAENINETTHINSIMSQDNSYTQDVMMCYKCTVKILMNLACMSTGFKPPQPEPQPEPQPNFQSTGTYGTYAWTSQGNSYTYPRGFKYFYDSAFDLTFEYPLNDPRAMTGLADIGTRQPKVPVIMITKAAQKENSLGCMNSYMQPQRPKPPSYPPYPPYPPLPPQPQPQPQQSWWFHPSPSDPGAGSGKGTITGSLWIVIGISLSTALIVVLIVAVLLLRRHRLKTAKKQNQDDNVVLSPNNQDPNTYIQLQPTYLSADRRLDVLSQTDYENLSAFVGPEWLIEQDALKFEEVIGEGHFGIVQRAKLNRRDMTLDVAVKKLHVGAKNVRKFLTEGILMEQFHHPNVLPLIGIGFTSYYLPMIITPFMQKADLLTYVKNGENRLTVRQLLKFGLEIAKGVEYLHDLKLIHRDLAARNCMLDDSLTVRIADFGLCRDISDSESYQTARASDIPVRWLPPETIENLLWTHKSDVWSFGIVLWELFSRGQHPYSRIPLVELRLFLCNGGRLAKPEGCHDIIYEFMKTCWHGDPEQRPDFRILTERIPALVQRLEGESILDLPSYYNVVTIAEIANQS